MFQQLNLSLKGFLMDTFEYFIDTQVNIVNPQCIIIIIHINLSPMLHTISYVRNNNTFIVNSFS